MAKCVYCKSEVENSVIDVCRKCGLAVWGENMFNAIVQNMEDAEKGGNLFQGSVSTSPKADKSSSAEKKVSTISKMPRANSLIQDAISELDAMNSDVE